MPVTTKVGAARVGGPKPCRSFSYQNLPEPSRVQAGVRYREFKLVSVAIIARVRAFWWLLRMDSGVTGVKPPQRNVSGTVDIRRVREIKSGFRRLPGTATRELPFRWAVVNTDARCWFAWLPA